jgi:hypothetical protein
MRTRSGREERVPYSLSRWTDVSGSQNKWEWFRASLAEGGMLAFDPRTAMPSYWSLKPGDTLGLNFWTKDPSNLLADRDLLRPYKVKIHMTITGWEEVEKGAPTLDNALWLLQETVKAYGRDNVTWRFSPVPMVPDVVSRFRKIADVARQVGLPRVLLAFLQENDLLPERRTPIEKLALLKRFAAEAPKLDILLCNDESNLLVERIERVAYGICAGPDEWEGDATPSEGCGCAIMIDPFTINESCTFGCQYCYAADKSLAPKKHNTTRSLPVVP